MTRIALADDQALVREGILRSEPGAHGGFRLARQPERITLMDVVAANLAAASAPATVSGNVYNIAPGQSSTLLELLDVLGRLLDCDPRPTFADPRPGDVPRACADASAARRDLGWKPSVSFADGLAHYVEWLRR